MSSIMFSWTVRTTIWSKEMEERNEIECNISLWSSQGGTTPETTEIWTHICSYHNFPTLSFVQNILIKTCCLLCEL